jgi:hypothetical protein
MEKKEFKVIKKNYCIYYQVTIITVYEAGLLARRLTLNCGLVLCNLCLMFCLLTVRSGLLKLFMYLVACSITHVSPMYMHIFFRVRSC